MKPGGRGHRIRTALSATAITCAGVASMMVFAAVHSSHAPRARVHRDPLPVCYLVDGKLVCTSSPASDSTAIR